MTRVFHFESVLNDYSVNRVFHFETERQICIMQEDIFQEVRGLKL